MWDEPTKQQLVAIPGLQQTRETPVDDRVVHVHFMLGGIDWYVVEFDGKDTFYGYIDYHDPLNEPEWQLFSFAELKNKRIHGAEVICDPYWQPKPFSERPINLFEVELPELTLTCGKCRQPFTDRLPIVIACVKAYDGKTPCCGRDGWFLEDGIVGHINTLLNQE